MDFPDAPEPTKQLEHVGLQFFIYATADDMGRASAINLAREQVRLIDEKGTTSLLLMAAPSAFGFYNAYAELAAESTALQEALAETHFFQFDDYPLPANHPATFRHLLEEQLFSRIKMWCDPDKIHALNAEQDDLNAECAAYTQTVLDHGPDLQLKGMGENGHWGFHEPGIPLSGDPAYVSVPLSRENVAQQMRDHPALFTSEDDVPTTAVTANVPLFMRTKVLIEDNVPQASKAFAFLATYANNTIDAAVPSSALKGFPNGIVRTTEAAASEWLHFLEYGAVKKDSLERMTESFGASLSGGIDIEYIKGVFGKMHLPFE